MPLQKHRNIVELQSMSVIGIVAIHSHEHGNMEPKEAIRDSILAPGR